MKKSFFKRGTSALLAVIMCLSAFLGIGSTTAFAAEGTTDEVVMFSFPREGDANIGGVFCGKGSCRADAKKSRKAHHNGKQRRCTSLEKTLFHQVFTSF